MHRILSLALVVLLIISIFCAAYAGQKEVIVALESVKGALESGVDLIELRRLLASAKTEINMAKHDRGVSKEFIDTAEECRSCYEMDFVLFQTCEDMKQLHAQPQAAECKETLSKHLRNSEKLLDRLYELRGK